MGLDSLAGTSYSANHTLVPTVIACDTTHLPRIPGYFHLGARWKNRRRSVTCLPAETAYSVEMIGPAAEPLLMTVHCSGEGEGDGSTTHPHRSRGLYVRNGLFRRLIIGVGAVATNCARFPDNAIHVSDACGRISDDDDDDVVIANTTLAYYNDCCATPRYTRAQPRSLRARL